MDVVIPCHPKDYEILNMCIDGIKNQVSNVYIITPYEFTCADPNVHFIRDDAFPFTRSAVQELLPPSEHDVVHWYFQQLLKLYAPQVIQGLSENFIVLDADVVVLKPIKFMTPSGIHRFGMVPSDEKENKYTRHMQRLHPEFVTSSQTNGVCDFQIWNAGVLDEIFKKVEEHHGNDKKFWQIFLEQVQETQGASEYEMYFHYYTRTRPHEFMTELQRTMSNKVSDIHKFRADGYHAVSFHRWMGPRI